VKICSLYGAGFYYIPGTDVCLKVGGFVRAEYNFNAGGSFSNELSGAPGANTRVFASTQDTWRSRGVVTLDARNQTPLGTLRSYIAMGYSYTNGGISNYDPRAFIQWAGFTAGLSTSFFDFFSFASVSNQTNIIGSETGGGGQMVFAYTWQFGNGLSASISLEDPNNGTRTQILYDNGNGFNAAGLPVGNNYGGTYVWPDVVANLHVDQSWGSAQIMGALHDVSASYYTGNPSAGTVEGNGHPGDEVGWAIGGGLKINLPALGHGDNINMQAAYTQGALGYAASGIPGNFAIYDGGTVGVGWAFDGVYSSGAGNGGNKSGIELTEAWSVGAGYTHHWDPMWVTTLYGGYLAVNYGGTATAFINAVTGAPAGSSNDYSFWQIGSRTTWTPTKGLDFSVDVMYENLNTGYNGLTATLTGPGNGKQPSTYTVSNQDDFRAIFRVQRNFYP
jgi:hypothetical protein